MSENELLEEAQTPGFAIAHLRESDLELLRLRKQNKLDLLTLKHIMEAEEDKVYDLEMVQARIISHYRRSVPFEPAQVTNALQELEGGDN